MEKTKKEILFCKIFFAITFILSCFTMNSDKLPGYFHSGGNVIIFSRYIFIIICVFVASILNRNNLDFLKKFVPCSTITISAIVVFDYYITQFSGSQFLYRVWWIASVFIANATVFIAITLFGKGDYKGFYKGFWFGFIPIYLFLFGLCFFRTPFGNDASTNFVIGNGTFLMLKAFVNNIHVSFEAPLIFFGNLLVMIPIPFIISIIFKRINSFGILIIGLIIPFIIEAYQYFFKCGNTDIDDIILNIFGFIVGFIIYSVIKKKRL